MKLLCKTLSLSIDICSPSPLRPNLCCIILLAVWREIIEYILKVVRSSEITEFHEIWEYELSDMWDDEDFVENRDKRENGNHW